MKRLARGITLVEWLAIMVLILCMLGGAHLGRAGLGGWTGFLLGGFLGLVAFLVFGFSMALFLDLAKGGGLPECRDGGCHGPGAFRGDGDYEVVEVGGEFYHQCKHGVRYERRGRRFVIVSDDGTETPYLVWRPFRGWARDRS